MGTTARVSSCDGWHNLSTRVTTALSSALLEWLLMLFLFISASFSYVITKFAGYCKLQTPCLFCSRLDHVLGKEKRGYYWDLICRGHKSEISSLVLCCAHDKLANIQGICETCILSSATNNKSNAETSRVLVDKLREESDSIFDQDPLLGEHVIKKCCSCCDQQWFLNTYDQKLVLTKSIGSRAADYDASDVAGNNSYGKRRAKPFVSVRDASPRNTQVDPLSRVGYTELKITSDTESDFEAPLSDDDGETILFHGTDDTNEDLRVPCEHMESCTGYYDEDLASGKPGTSVSVFEPLLSESGMQSKNTDIRGTQAATATVESGNDLVERDWQQVERSSVCPSPSKPISFNDVPTSSNKTEVPVDVSKENYDLTTDEVRLKSEQRPVVNCEKSIKSGKKLITSESGLESTFVSSDIGQQNPVLLDLGDAYKLAVSNKGRQLSGLLVDHWLGKDSTRVSEDLKTLLSQFSMTRGTDLSVNEISPRLSINSDEVKNSDVSNSAGMQILQKMISLERNESGLSLDGSIVSEIEGESLVDKLKRQVDHDRKLMSALYKELEEERNASAIAANQALAMITRLQEEKATLHMEALQYLRMMDEQSEYEMEALQKTNDLLAEKEKEIENLEARLEFYRNKLFDESVPENMVEPNSEIKVKDIGLDHSQCTFIVKDGSFPEKSVAENPNTDKADILPASLEEKNVGSVKSSPLEFQDEELYISEHFKKLEKQVYSFLNIHQARDNWPNPENSEWESPQNCEKLDNNLQMEDSVSSLELNLDVTGDDPSYKKFPVCNQNGELPSSVSNFVGRLQVLEADHSFLEHTINLLSKGDNGLKLLQEIADHLQQLRMIRIKEMDKPVA